MTDETPKLGWTTDAPDRFHELHIGFKGVDYTVELGDDGIWSTTFGGEWYPGYEAIEGGEGSDLAKVQAACEAHHVAQMLARGYVPVEDLTAAKNAIQEFLAANEAVPAADAGLGIVDPFIGHPVEPGERFWLIVHPRTITSLRHVWEHPAFGEAGAAIKDEKAVSEQWLRDFINRSDCPSYEEVIGKAVAYAKGDAGWDDDYLHFDGVDAHGEIDPEFWRHFEVVTGIKVEKGASYFSCAC